MTPEKLKDPGAQILIKIAIKDISTSLVNYHIFPNSWTLYESAVRAWTAVNCNPELITKIEDEIKQKGEALKQLGMGSEDLVRRRYNPILWLENIPEEYKGGISQWIFDRSETLLEFLETFDSQK